MCGWKNALQAFGMKRVFWLRIKPNSNFISGTFMYSDHTTYSREGSYLVWPQLMHDRSSALLKSPLLHRKSAKICFSLYYFARPANNKGTVSAFTVRFVDLTRQTSTAEVVNASDLMDWVQYRREFSNLPRTYQFFIESTYNSAIKSDIGIDDIRIENKGCGGDATPTSTTPLPVSETLLDCNFDRPPCNWDFDKSVWNVTDFKDRKLIILVIA